MPGSPRYRPSWSSAVSGAYRHSRCTPSDEDRSNIRVEQPVASWSVFREHPIRTAGEDFPVQTEAQAHPVSDSADGQFGCRVASTNPRHQLAASPAVHDIGHAPSLNRRGMREAPSADAVS